ncbi:Fra10ac1 [Symbiodinium natans]|uniref:Fra10ac1 protein n=1 Tax=Symbiodinium natans TaxID=878477 RepID=A0A812IHV8_9DINO|nr:Fra10ac1 [Symbiodinium natans]
MPGVAAGYGSDDEGPAPVPYGYGALPGDRHPRKRTAAEIQQYGIQQNSSGHVRSRLGVELQLRPTLAETRPRPSLQYHKALLELVQKAKVNVMKSDYDILRENHRFLRSDEADDKSWESRLARRYYDRLFKEYVICDLSGYRNGQVGFRWRTEAEVLHGRGQFSCGHKHCSSKDGLRSYEVDFKYVEECSKRALVKVRLCQDCAFKLHYQRLKKARKQRRRAGQSGQKGGSQDDADLQDAHVSENGTEVAEVAEVAEASVPTAPTPSTAATATASDLRLLEALAWQGPDPNIRSREDDIDDFLRDLFP